MSVLSKAVSASIISPLKGRNNYGQEKVKKERIDIMNITKPQVFTAIVSLTVICMAAMFLGQTEVAVGAGAGILALGLKVLELK